MPPLMDGNTFGAILTIIFTCLLGSYTFTFFIWKALNNEVLDRMEQYHSIIERYAAMEEGYKTLRKVQEGKLMEAFLGK